MVFLTISTLVPLCKINLDINSYEKVIHRLIRRMPLTIASLISLFSHQIKSSYM